MANRRTHFSAAVRARLPRALKNWPATDGATERKKSEILRDNLLTGPILVYNLTYSTEGVFGFQFSAKGKTLTWPLPRGEGFYKLFNEEAWR